MVDAQNVALEGGFEPGRVYDVVYRTADPRILGCGLAGTRDLISFFKYDTSPGPIAVTTSLLVLAVLVSATVWAWSRRSRSHMALCTTALIACAGAFITAGSAPVAYHSTEFLYPRRVWWMLGVLIWVALAHTAVTLAAERLPATRSRSDTTALVHV